MAGYKSATLAAIADSIAANKENIAVTEQDWEDQDLSSKTRSGQEGYKSFNEIVGFDTGIDKYFKVYERSDWDEQVRHLIPESNPYIKVNVDYALAICMSIENNQSLLAYGPPGTGKTVTPKEICARIGYPYVYIQGMGGTEPADYVGSPWLSKDEETGAGVMEWKDAIASFAVRHGAFLLFDEPFKVAPQTNMCFQSLLDDRKELKLYGHPNPIKSTLKAHPNFRICLCDNVRGVGDGVGKYAAEVQDQSTMDRMDMVIKLDYLPQEEEISILSNKFPDVPVPLISKIVHCANLIRTSWAKDDVTLPFSMRKTENWLRHIRETGNVPLSFRLTYLNGCTAVDEIHAVKKMYDMVNFGSGNNL